MSLVIFHCNMGRGAKQGSYSAIASGELLIYTVAR
jgi:hypothetical protein